MEQPEDQESHLNSENKLLAKDKLCLLRILPSEIWHHVVTRLPQQHVQDTLENISNSSPFYRQLFDNQKTTFLFGKVLSLLVNNNYLELNNVLNCREVCKIWNKEIDKTLTRKDCKLSTFIKTNEFESYNKIVKFLAHFEHTHPKNGRSPFIGDKITMTVTDEYEFVDPNTRQVNQLKLNLISNIFQRHGIHIKNLSINFHFVDNVVLKRALIEMRVWLTQTKYLTKLTVKNLATHFDRFNLERGKPFLSESYPKLDKLVELHVNQCIPDDVGLDMIKNNSHVCKLTVERNWRSAPSFLYQMSEFPAFPNLTYLDINTNTIGKMQNLRNADFKHLSTLTLTSKREYSFDHQTRWTEIFSIIESRFGDTLKRLSVEMESHDSQVLSDTRSFRLNLPKLKEFRLLINGAQVSLDFLFPMKELLERICVMSFRSYHVESDNVFKELNFQKIWVANLVEFFDLLHFDKSFGDIQKWVKGAVRTRGMYNLVVGNKLILQ